MAENDILKSEIKRLEGNKYWNKIILNYIICNSFRAFEANFRHVSDSAQLNHTTLNETTQSTTPTQNNCKSVMMDAKVQALVEKLKDRYQKRDAYYFLLIYVNVSSPMSNECVLTSMIGYVKMLFKDAF